MTRRLVDIQQMNPAEGLASGKLKKGDSTFDAGRLGAKKIEGDQILLGKILVFTKENIDQFDF